MGMSRITNGEPERARKLCLGEREVRSYKHRIGRRSVNWRRGCQRNATKISTEKYVFKHKSFCSKTSDLGLKPINKRTFIRHQAHKRTWSPSAKKIPLTRNTKQQRQLNFIFRFYWTFSELSWYYLMWNTQPRQIQSKFVHEIPHKLPKYCASQVCHVENILSYVKNIANKLGNLQIIMCLATRHKTWWSSDKVGLNSTRSPPRLLRYVQKTAPLC